MTEDRVPTRTGPRTRDVVVSRLMRDSELTEQEAEAMVNDIEREAAQPAPPLDVPGGHRHGPDEFICDDGDCPRAQPAPPLDVVEVIESFRYSEPLVANTEPHRMWQRNEETLDAILARLGSAPSAPPLDVRPEVAAFASMMERVLRDNDHKGGWQDCEPSWLLDRLRQEVNELDAAMRKGTIARRDESGRTSDWPADVSREAADVANFAMMIVDVLGLGSAPSRSEPDPASRTVTQGGIGRDSAPFSEARR